jgi:hypothetical protein
MPLLEIVVPKSRRTKTLGLAIRAAPAVTSSAAAITASPLVVIPGSPA